MKIAFYSGEMGRKNATKIIEMLKDHAPQHYYNHHADQQEVDLWHCLSPRDSLLFLSKATRSVVSLSDMRFITHPELFSLRERIFRLPLYRYHCRHAAKLIAHNSQAKDRVVEALGVEDSHVDICMPLLTSQLPCLGHKPSQHEMLEVRDKFDLPEIYILVVGEMDTMHDHGVILHSIFEQSVQLNIVVYGRRTTHADVLLKMVRDVGAASRVQFIYEASQIDLCSIYRMSLMMIYMPSFESSVTPIVEALHQGTPMILSDTPLNREAAGKAAKYVALHDKVALSAMIKMMIYNESFRGQLVAQCWAEAKRYSKQSVAEQLAKIYESV